MIRVIFTMTKSPVWLDLKGNSTKFNICSCYCQITSPFCITYCKNSLQIDDAPKNKYLHSSPLTFTVNVAL